MGDCFVVSGVAVWIESARPPDRCVLCLVCAAVCRAAQCDRRTHSDAERTCPAVSSHRHTRQDRCACLSTAAATQARQAATPSRPSAHTQRRCTPQKCKRAVDCHVWLNLNFFSKRNAMTVIYRLTVQTLPGGLETRFTPPDTTQHCIVLWTGHKIRWHYSSDDTLSPCVANVDLYKYQNLRRCCHLSSL